MGPTGVLGVLGATNVAGIRRAAGVTGATAVTGVVGATGVTAVTDAAYGGGGRKVPQGGCAWGTCPHFQAGGGGLVGLVVFSCESWVVSCLEWSPAGIARPVGGWTPQGLEAGALSC